MLINQNFSIPQGDDGIVAFDVDESVRDIDTLVGCRIWWEAYEEAFACPVPGIPALISKSSDALDISIPDSPSLRFYVQLIEADTANLLRNYYHEAKILTPQLLKVTVACGIMTVTPTEVRQP